jgi:hypothetical protein
MKLLACFLPVIVATSGAFGATVTFSLDQPVQSTTAGSFILLSGAIVNIGPETVYLNGITASLPYFELVADAEPFFLEAPAQLGAGEAYSGNLLRIAVSAVAAPGDYFGVVSIQGGDDFLALEDLGIQEFQIAVSNVPEPALGILTGVVGPMFLSRRLCSSKKH